MKGAWRKIYVSIFDSAWLAQDLNLRAFAMELILLADARGIIRMDYGAIAQRVGRRDVNSVMSMLEELCEPLVGSRSHAFNGAFLVCESPTCWRIVNFEKYQQSTAKVDRRKAQWAKNSRKYRTKKREEKERHQASSGVIKTSSPPSSEPSSKPSSDLPSKTSSEPSSEPSPSVITPSPSVIKTSPSIEKEIEKESTHRQDGCVRKNELITSEWVAQLAQDPMYSGLNVRREFAKMSNEYKAQRRTLTRGGFVKWLNNRADDRLIPDSDDGEVWESAEVMDAIGRALGQ
jgi:hypothetical protein